MNIKNSLVNILSRWPDRKSLADDLGVDVIAVHRWHQRGNVPARYFAGLLSAAKGRGISLSSDELIDAASISTDQDGHKSSSFKSRNADDLEGRLIVQKFDGGGLESRD